MSKEADVSTPSLAYNRLEKLRKLPRDLRAGLPAIKDHATVYLPREPMEQPVQVQGVGLIDPWLIRVERSRLDNRFLGAVESLTGRVFTKRPQFDDDTPPQIEEFAEDVDGEGTDLPVFSLDVAQESVAEGASFVLVEYPRVADGEAVVTEDVKRAGLRPVWRHYSPKSVIAWSKQKRGGEKRLSIVRLVEHVTEPDGAWGEVEVKQIRVFYAGNPDAQDDSRWVRWEVYRKNEKEEWIIFDQGIRRPQVDIPLVPWPSEGIDPMAAQPTMIDLAWLNLAHLRKTSDLDSAQHAVGFPFFHWSGVDPDDAEAQLSGGLGSKRFLISPDAAGRAGFVEPQGTSWAAIEASLQEMEEQMDQMAADPSMAKAPESLTATGEELRASKTTSRLSTWVTRWEDALRRLFYFTAIDLGIVSHGAEDGWGGVTLNRKFVPVNRDTDGVRIAHERNLAGKLSDETTFEVMQRAEIVPDALEYKEEQARLRLDGPALGMIGREDEEDDAGSEA